MMQFSHGKAKLHHSNVTLDDHGSKIQRFFLQIKKLPDNRTTRRNNEKCLRKMELLLQGRRYGVLNYNLAELFYNGECPGIPRDLTKCFEHYVQTWESPRETFSHTLVPMLVPNMVGLMYHIAVDNLRVFATRLHSALETANHNCIPQMQLLATMCSARVADQSSQKDKGIVLYTAAKAMAVALGKGFEEQALECSERRAVLNAMSQEALDKVLAKYQKRRDKLRMKDTNRSESQQHTTPGIPMPSCIRSCVQLKEGVDKEQLMAELDKINKHHADASGADRCTVTVTEMNVHSCGGCGKKEEFLNDKTKFKRCAGKGSKSVGVQCTARYCSRECQKLDWKEHRKVCSTYM